MKAEDLTASNQVVDAESDTVPVVSVEFLEKETTVYNFEVLEHHNYFVSALELLVRNVCEGAGDGLTGSNGEFNSQNDVDLRCTGQTYQDGLDEAFKRTGVPKEEFTVTKWGTNEYGKSIPVEWQGPNGANVNMDIPQWNNVKPNGQLGEGPHAPHIGYQTAGKGSNRIRGHIFVDKIPATRR